MTIDSFHKILTESKSIQQLATVELKSIVEEFPYFQTARALYLKGLKNGDSFKYNNELKITAAHTKDRTVLFNYITSKSFNQINSDIHEQISEKIEQQKKEVVVSLEPREKIKEELNIGKPITFSSSESHSFNQWLQLSTKKTLQTPKKLTDTKTIKTKIVVVLDLKCNQWWA